MLDLRILAMTASIPATGYGPEQVIDVDLAHPDPVEILAQLETTTVCGLVADPAAHRDLRWKMTACLLTEDDRCDADHPQIELGSGLLADPDDSATPQVPCADLIPNQTLLTILKDAVEANPVQALGGIDYGVVLAVDDLADPATNAVAAKHLRIAARIPVTRRPNTNPSIDYLDAAVSGVGLLIPRARCGDPPFVSGVLPQVRSGAIVTLFPVEPDGTHEEYDAPTLDGGSATLTETITYQWLAGNGSFSDQTTGGGHDLLGNQSLLGTEWRSPKQLHEAQDVSIWMIQRDERYGVNVLETCIEVTP